jgi:hypothetical protein
MNNNVNDSTNNSQGEIFSIDVIEENSVIEDMLCNHLGCA